MRKLNPRHDRILTLWAEGHTGSEIAELTCASSKAMVNAVVHEWRQLGDPRAAKRPEIIYPDRITREFLLSIFAYDADKGDLRWLRTSGSAKRGELAGYEQQGYRRVEIGGETYLLHHLIWLVETGELPVGQLDHENTDKTDSRFSNLRPCTQSQNSANRGANKNNTSGFKGVKFVKRNTSSARKPFEAWITHQGKPHYLGCFDTAREGSVAYEAAAKRLFGEFARAA